MRMRCQRCRVGTPAAVSANNKMQRWMIWRWEVCTTVKLLLLNLCCPSLLALRYRSILIRPTLVRMVVISDIRIRSHRMGMSLSSMGMVVNRLELRRRTRLASTRRRVTTLLLLLLRELRESLLVARGGRFESFSLLGFLLQSCIAMAFSVCPREKETGFWFFFRDTHLHYMGRTGQVAGSSCPASSICLSIILVSQLSMLFFYQFKQFLWAFCHVSRAR